MAICSFAQDHTAKVPNVGGAIGPIRFGVIHIMAGTLAGTDSWFQNPAAQVSAHFGIGKDGTIIQWVDTSRVAWAEMNYNGEALSIEHEGQSGDQLTDAQILSLEKVMQWCAFIHGIPFARTSDPNGTGWIGHGELGVSGGDHPDCPGQPILDQLPLIIYAAGHSTPPVPTPPTPKPMPVLRPGAIRPAVQTLRTLLRRQGYNVPALGLHYGVGLQAAVIAFKKAHGLTPDAIVAGKTWAALRKMK